MYMFFFFISLSRFSFIHFSIENYLSIVSGYQSSAPEILWNHSFYFLKIKQM